MLMLMMMICDCLFDCGEIQEQQQKKGWLFLSGSLGWKTLSRID